MLLVQLPAIDTVPGLALVDRLPSFGLAARLKTFSHQLTVPSLWLTVLATLVIFSTIRAALLFFRPTPLSSQKGGVTLIPGVGVVQAEKGARNNCANAGSPDNHAVIQEKREEKTMSSAFWGLLRWDSLPLPRRDVRTMSCSETERGRWTTQQEGLRIQLPQGKRTGPAFERPLPAIYQTEVPVSMAKMIMSRHTFRRPGSRPPPVRNTNAPQYSKKLPSMV
jgi:hypothetical protein